MRNETKEKNIGSKELLSWIYTMVIAILVAVLIKNFIIINCTIPTGSMENTIMIGDNLIGFRLAYNFWEPERGDVIIFPAPDVEDTKYIKRIIGLPGETVNLRDGAVYIDGNLLEEDYIKEDWLEWTTIYGEHSYTVPENCYFVMGDNRNGSSDARYWDSTGTDAQCEWSGTDQDPIKYIPKDIIIGKANFIYWPIRDWRKL